MVDVIIRDDGCLEAIPNCANTGCNKFFMQRTPYKSNRREKFFNHLVSGLPQIAYATSLCKKPLSKTWRLLLGEERKKCDRGERAGGLARRIS